MDRRTLSLLIGVVVVLIAIVAIAGGGGLRAETKALVSVELENFDEAQDEFDRQKKAVEQALASEPKLFEGKGLNAAWTDRLANANERLKSAATGIEAIKSLTEEDDDNKRVEIESALESLRAARIYSLGESTELLASANKRIDFKKNLKTNLSRMEEAYQAIRGADLSETETIVTRAQADWPQKKEDLAGRLKSISQLFSRSERAMNDARTAADGSPIDYDVLIASSAILAQDRANVPANIRNIKTLVDQLYWSWDKILVDLEIKEGSDVTFHQKLKKISTRIVDTKSHENETKAEETWVQVDKTKYLAMEDNLGMTVEYKPAGKYDHEIENVAQPPGYSYIASPEKGSNQYGQWERRSGGSFWVFYGQYSLMRNLFWGNNVYRPMNTSTYRNYDTARRSGRSYYGSDASGKRRYGSSGSVTKTRYSGSKYQRASGYKNTQFKKSGGSYRGSRYVSRSSSTRSSRSRSSSSRSRFGGGK